MSWTKLQVSRSRALPSRVGSDRAHSVKSTQDEGKGPVWGDFKVRPALAGASAVALRRSGSASRDRRDRRAHGCRERPGRDRARCLRPGSAPGAGLCPTVGVRRIDRKRLVPELAVMPARAFWDRRERRCAGGQIETLEDLARNVGILDGSDQSHAGPALAAQTIRREHALEELCPAQPSRGSAGGRGVDRCLTSRRSLGASPRRRIGCPGAEARGRARRCGVLGSHGPL